MRPAGHLSGRQAGQPMTGTRVDGWAGGQDPDAALLAAYAAGNRVAARALTDRLTPRAYAQAMRWLSDRAEAEDVAQEAMLRLWRIAPQWQANGAKVTTWLYRVVANLATDRLRQRRGHAALDQVAEPADPTPSAATAMQQAQRQRALSDALARMPPRQAQAVALRHLEGLTNPDIAAVMDITVEAVESLTARGLRSLTAILAGQRADLGFEDET